jgi:hypothetical protein
MALAQAVLAEHTGAVPTRLDSAAVIAGRDRLIDQPRALAELLGAGSVAPEDLWPARGIGALFGTIARVGATGSWRELIRAALAEG